MLGKHGGSNGCALTVRFTVTRLTKTALLIGQSVETDARRGAGVAPADDLAKLHTKGLGI
jgi:hypothetical protein